MLILTYTYIVLFVVVLLYRRYWTKSNNHKNREPPIIHPKIPFFGHIIGMIWYKKSYYELLRDQNNLPIATLPLPGSRVYTVFSVSIIQDIQKQSKALAFQPIQAKFSVKLCGASNEAYQILQKHTDEDNGEYGNIYTAMHHGLNPGTALNDMNNAMIKHVCECIDTIGPTKTVRLDAWLRHNVTLATTNAVYGPYNPFKKSTVENAFWRFERAIPQLIFLPSWLAQRGANNRRIVANAFQDYFVNNHHEQASVLVKDFYAAECSYGFSLSDRSLFEVGQSVATLANTYAAVFWLIFYVFSTPDALREIRQEISFIITRSVAERKHSKIGYVLDMTKVDTHCPTLVSAFREAIRLHSVGISLRKVCRDTTVNGTYRLKKNATVLMPTVAIHTDPRVWGSDVLTFDHRRFLHTKGSDAQKYVPPAAFRSFGGGTTLCPGRHFATTQIMAWASMLVMRFDMEPTSPRGKWVQPTTENSNLANVIMRPDHDLEVRLTTREAYDDGEWDVKLSGKEALFQVTVEDL